MQRNLQVGRGTLSAFLRSLGTTRCSSQGFIGLQHWRPAPLPLPAPASNQSSTVKARRFRSASFCLKPGLETALQRLALGVRGLAGADTEWAPRPSAALQASGTARFQSTGARARRQGRLGALLGAASLKDRSTARVKQRARPSYVRVCCFEYCFEETTRQLQQLSQVSEGATPAMNVSNSSYQAFSYHTPMVT